MLTRDSRRLEWKIGLFRRYFSGLQHVYGTYNPADGKSWQIKRPVTDEVIAKHLAGREPYGVYLLNGDVTRAVVADFDAQDANPPLAFIYGCQRYGLHAYLETSKSKGYHVFLFFPATGVPAVKARAVVRHILAESECGTVEVFPKQDRIDVDAGHVGNFINAPLFGRALPHGKTVFVDPANGLKPYPNQWEFLESIVITTEAQLDEIIEVNEIVLSPSAAVSSSAEVGTWQGARGLPPCALRMLSEGVTSLQRLSCFRLATHFRRMGVPAPIAIAALLKWRESNHPANGKRILTAEEVENQVAHAYLKAYCGYGCNEPEVAPHCSSSCHLYPAVMAQRRGARPTN
ncbi:MAG: hypothetical protein AMXMBFR84_27570 [Candidatus Hydrogenedentota bacterium]